MPSPLRLKKNATSHYSSFVDQLRRVVRAPDKTEANALLDGAAGRSCLELVDQQSVRELGAFFTPSHTARKLVEEFSVAKWDDETVFDPACGAGDLLLAVAKSGSDS